MARNVRLMAIQPLYPTAYMPPREFVATNLALLEEALRELPDLVCLPEYFNCLSCMGDLQAERISQIEAPAHHVLEAVSARAAASRCYVVLPLIIKELGNRYNRTFILGRDGKVVGYFDKVHTTQIEGEQFQLTAGSDWPTFDLDFGRIGVMICYDGCFTESSRALALRGAEIILWPSLQRTYTRAELELQTRSHAYFNYSVIVRSSYAGPSSGFGFSCICGADGNLLAELDGIVGCAAAEVDLDNVPMGPRTYGGVVGCLREMRFQDRRPSAYRVLTEPTPYSCLPPRE